MAKQPAPIKKTGVPKMQNPPPPPPPKDRILKEGGPIEPPKSLTKEDKDWLANSPDILDWTPKINPEAFLVSKGIDPPIKSMPLQNISFDKLVELLNEFKG